MKRFRSIRKLHGLSVLLIAASILNNPCVCADDGEVLYGNLAKFQPKEGNGVFSAADLKAVLAQPFTSGDSGTIGSVKFPVERFGNPTGIVPVEIWDDVDGLPGKKIATIGTFDISTIALRQDGGEVLHFETEIQGLEPNQTYYLLTDDRNTDVTGSNKTYGVPTTPANDDTNGAGKMLGSADGGESWVVVGDVQTGRNYRIMEILECLPASSEVALYDNIPDPLPEFHPGVVNGVGNAGPPGPSELQPLSAQPFFTNAWGTLDSVTIYIVGKPEVKGTIDVVVTENDAGVPGETVAVLGTIDLESLTVWDDAPVLGDLITYEPNLTGLEPNATYYVGFDITNMEDPAGRFPNATFFNLFSTEDDGTNGAGLSMAGPFGEWRPLSDFVEHAKYMLMRVTASPPPAVDVIAPENGSINIDPDIESVSVGDTITVSATPDDGFEFVNWLYGDEEITSNPATITINELGLPLTAIFAESSLPLNIDISEAVAVTWDSEAAKTYQIHRSSDMETWEVAIDAIQGTGERMMQAFVREETEEFYRVEVTP